MIGNDIVDLRLAKMQSDWRRKGYLQKIFTAEEISWIESAANSDSVLWRIWSMKESAYKIVSRETDLTFYAPQKFNCNIIDEFYGSVQFEELQYQVKTTSTEDYVYSIATNKLESDFKSDRFKLESDRVISISQECEERVLNSARSNLGWNDLKLIKNSLGVPDLLSENENKSIPVSISHHGRFGAFTFLKTIS